MILATGSLSAERDVAQHQRHYEVTSDAGGRFPLNYIYGSVVDRTLIRDQKGKYGTNITFQPRYASQLFMESLLFCGNRAELFNGMQGPVVVTYSRIAHKMVRDVPCFDLVSVDRVAPDEI